MPRLKWSTADDEEERIIIKQIIHAILLGPILAKDRKSKILQPE